MRATDMFWGLLGCGVLIGAWEVAARGCQGFVMPSPAATLIALCDILSQPDFWRDDFRICFERFVCGIALGGGAGICLGLAAGFYKQLRLALTPARWMLSSVPGVVVVMLGMLWFGIDSEMVIFVVALTVVPTVYVGVVEGIRSVDSGLQEMIAVYRITRLQRFWHVYLPAITAPLLSSSIIALGGGMRVTILAETIGATCGLGHALAIARTNLDTAALYALALVSMLLVGVLEAALLLLTRHNTSQRKAR